MTMRHHRWIVGLALLLTACGAPSHRERDARPTECDDIGPFGTSDQFTLGGQVLDGVTVAEPRSCPEGHYIRLEHPGGTYPIAMGRDEEGAIRGCQSPPAEGSGCTAVHADALFLAVRARLEEQGIHTIGIGLGPCGEVSPDYEGWNYSIAINDWAHADAAVRALAAAMVEWNARGPGGVAVREIPCGVLLTESGR